MHRNKLLTTQQLAEFLEVAISTLAQYRMDGTGPQYIKLGHLVRYRLNDVETWLEAKKNGYN